MDLDYPLLRYGPYNFRNTKQLPYRTKKDENKSPESENNNDCQLFFLFHIFADKNKAPTFASR